MPSKSVCLAALSLLAAACSSSSGSSSGAGDGERAAAVKNYGALVSANYSDAVAQAKLLQTAVKALVAAPSQATHEAAKAAWVAARPAYTQTEAFRFYGGPIDNEADGPEGMINGWPIDEGFVDYVVGDDAAGIINKRSGAGFLFPTVDRTVITDENQKGGEKNLSAGWHVIEFLLWGQDLDPDGKPHAQGPGQRPYTDFVDGGTASNQGRRRAYLDAATDLMVSQLEGVAAKWAEGPTSYRGTMEAGNSDAALGNVLKGIGSLAGGELSKQRMNNAYQTKEQEEEHSCFSDTTNQDLVGNGTGIENVYLGRYTTVTGTSISDLVKSKDAALDAKTRADLTAALAATKAIPAPFDLAILGADDSDGRRKIKAAIDAWGVVTKDIVAVANTLGVTINLVNP